MICLLSLKTNNLEFYLFLSLFSTKYFLSNSSLRLYCQIKKSQTTTFFIVFPSFSFIWLVFLSVFLFISSFISDNNITWLYPILKFISSKGQVTDRRAILSIYCTSVLPSFDVANVGLSCYYAIHLLMVLVCCFLSYQALF